MSVALGAKLLADCPPAKRGNAVTQECESSRDKGQTHDSVKMNNFFVLLNAMCLAATPEQPETRLRHQ